MKHVRTSVLTIGFAAIALATACSQRGPEPDPPTSRAATTSAAPAATDSATLVVYKEATCPCCKAWVDYMRGHGYRVVTYDVSDLDAIKQKHGIAAPLQACHTTEVGGYFVEGHVPDELVRRLLSERPPIAGLTVPGMPVGSPGMEVGPAQPYDILAVDSAGGTSVFDSRGK